MRILAIVLCTAGVLCAAPVQAQKGIRYDRMGMACLNKPASCQGLVDQIEKKMKFAQLVREGSGFSELWTLTMTQARQLIEKLKKDFPGVWEAQNCPMGECHMPWDTPPAPSPHPGRIQPFDPSMRSI